MKTIDWKVGMQVYVRDVNEKRNRPLDSLPPKVEIVKVGRTIVYTKTHFGEKPYSKEDGRAHDKYKHAWLQTIEDYNDEKESEKQMNRIRALGVEFRPGIKKFMAKDYTQIADLLESIFKEAP